MSSKFFFNAPHFLNAHSCFPSVSNAGSATFHFYTAASLDVLTSCTDPIRTDCCSFLLTPSMTATFHWLVCINFDVELLVQGQKHFINCIEDVKLSTKNAELYIPLSEIC